MNINTVDQHFAMAVDTLANGGGTYGRDVFRAHKLPYRYTVAVGKPHVRTVPVADGPSALASAIRELADLRGVWTPDYALGTWVNDGLTYVDIVESFEDLDKALFFAQERGELAIWDSVEQVEIPVPVPARQAA
ncbi:hypothetical protein J4U01_gp080 [Mycobacterium phage Kumao]|uniref:Uncharacterized protein n=1 Tax=Mycobacterium phage Kumao TaxID=2041344 RepID=A0A2D1GQ39_9CAUD|nr:hypothetical protein J4U01_gp080 [Mycobacterium phage Kumao]ATN94078.1 hypothetical protein SEA_KUMAO_116 [Mycobacterium phage Kumao]